MDGLIVHSSISDLKLVKLDGWTIVHPTKSLPVKYLLVILVGDEVSFFVAFYKKCLRGSI